MSFRHFSLLPWDPPLSYFRRKRFLACPIVSGRRNTYIGPFHSARIKLQFKGRQGDYGRFFRFALLLLEKHIDCFKAQQGGIQINPVIRSAGKREGTKGRAFCNGKRFLQGPVAEKARLAYSFTLLKSMTIPPPYSILF